VVPFLGISSPRTTPGAKAVNIPERRAALTNVEAAAGAAIALRFMESSCFKR
jgi:hypothetical protein